MSVIVVRNGSKLSQTMSMPSRSSWIIEEPDEPGGAVSRLMQVAVQVHGP